MSIAAMLTALLWLPGCERSDFGAATGKREPAVEQKLFSLAHMNGCLDCHTSTVSKFGPSWNEIARRYKDAPREDARALLIDRVRNGSQGQYINWKTADGMPPLKNRVSDAHIEELVDYILDFRD